MKDDQAWIRARQARLVDLGEDPEDALAQACQERVEYLQRTSVKKAAERRPLRVTLADIVNARKGQEEDE